MTCDRPRDRRPGPSNDARWLATYTPALNTVSLPTKPSASAIGHGLAGALAVGWRFSGMGGLQPLAIFPITSAWQGEQAAHSTVNGLPAAWVGQRAHQQARFRPARSWARSRNFHISSENRSIAQIVAARSVVNAPHCTSSSVTSDTCHQPPQSSTTNLLPYFPGRLTQTVSSGSRQPLTRLRWMRFGVASVIGPSILLIGRVRPARWGLLLDVVQAAPDRLAGAAVAAAGLQTTAAARQPAA